MTARLIMLLPHFPPDVAADGQLFWLLARELARSGVQVRVLTWRPRYQGLSEPAPSHEPREGVEIRRCWAPAGGKSLLGRAFAAWWLTYTGFWRALFTGGTLLIPSSPPTLGLVGWWLSWIGRRYVYVLHDLHPELGIALGRMKPGLVTGLLRFVQRRNLARGRTIAITDGMAENARKLQPKTDVQVIENWADVAAISPQPKAASQFAKAHGYAGAFTVQYSGNLGLLHPLDGLVGAMRELPDCKLAFIGRGARLEATRAAAQGTGNIHFHDYQPLGELADSLSACDVAAVALEPGADKLAMPSKLVGILASGRPVLALCPETSELGQLVAQSGCGVVVNDCKNPKAVADAIAQLKADPATLAEMARKARELATRRFGLAEAARTFEGLLSL
ncbi:MAG: glycosyltransferase family 4 protein [Planctomycetes bacterium]|nr:glycosyltransferase family 4 protein [Planctomycetota bacterium]